MNKCHSLGHNEIQDKNLKYKNKHYIPKGDILIGDIVLIFIYFATIQLIYIIDIREYWNMKEQLQKQSNETEFWNVESEDVPELEESDIPGVYFNEFREYVDEEGNVLSPSEVDAIRYKDDYEDDYYR